MPGEPGVMDEQTAHDFWFGGPLDDVAFVRARVEVWFNTDFAFDDEVRRRFSAVHERAAAGDLAHWADSARGLLMLVVLLDQMPRNIHRGTPRAFATDAHARALSETAFARGFDSGLSLIERVFLYMPFEHCEDLAAQDFCVAGYQRLHAEAPPEFRDLMQSCVEAGQAHRDVIRRFGRFPHRNPILGRTSSPEEIAWSANHHGWGQGEKVLRKQRGA
jgi:uncharacterized protein (DUF924 family)